MNWIVLFILNKIYQTPLLLSIYRAYKYIVHYTTNTSEIYRLCNYAAATNNEKEIRVSKDIMFRIDQSIQHSKQLLDEKIQLKSNTCQVSQVLESIMVKKQFPTIHDRPAQVLNLSLTCIHESHRVLDDIEKNITIKYNPDDKSHEERLIQVTYMQ